MAKRTAAAAGILALILLGGLWGGRRLEGLCSRQLQLLSRGREEQAWLEWQRAEPWAAALVSHQVLDPLRECYAELVSAPPEQRAPLRARLCHWLRAVEDYDRLCIRSLF